jgi:hypothetical protein
MHYLEAKIGTQKDHCELLYPELGTVVQACNPIYLGGKD